VDPPKHGHGYATLITGARRCDQISQVLVEFHGFLSGDEWSIHVACLVHQSLSGQAPAYSTDDINLVANSGRRLLRSAVDRTCVVPRTHNTYGDKSFTAAGRVYGTVCRRTYDETLATNNLSEHWKDFCLGGNWPRRIVTFLLSVRVRNTLTNLLTLSDSLREI